MCNNRRELHGEITSTNTRLESLTSEVSTAVSEVAAFENIEREAQTLRHRAEAIRSGSEEINTLIPKRLVEYQALKNSTDDFRSWISDLKGQTAAGQIVGVSSQMLLLDLTNRIVSTFPDKEVGDVKAICNTLKRPKYPA